MKIVATVCSRKKLEHRIPMPARKRYRGEHIDIVDTIAGSVRRPFYILSGLLGLLCASDEIDFYDYLLTEDKSEALGDKVAEQLAQRGITFVDFHIQDGEKWKPYEAAMRRGAAVAGVALVVHTLKGH